MSSRTLKPASAICVFRLADRVGAEMEDRGGEHRAGMAVANARDQMVEIADAAGCDDRNGDSVRDRPDERQIVAALGAVAVHGGDEQFAGAELRHLTGERDSVDAGGVAAAMREDFPTIG